MQGIRRENRWRRANVAIGRRCSVPRRPIDNTRNGTGSAGNYRDFQVLERAARMPAMGINAMTRLGTLGSAAVDARAHSFARFVQGIAYGNLALAYDSAALLNDDDAPTAIVPLVGYQA